MCWKIAFLADDGLVENMFADPVADGAFRLSNTPFYVYGISFQDEFAVSVRDERLFFDRVTKRGGHSTYRVKMPAGASHDDFMELWPCLEKFGCSYEGSASNRRRLYAIDIPPGADVHAVYDELVRGEEAGHWEFEEGHYFDGSSPEKPNGHEGST